MADLTNNQPKDQPKAATPPEASAPATPPGWVSRYKRPLQAAAVIILIIIVAVAAWQARQQNNPGQPSSLQAATACAQGKHQAISFLKPTVLAARYVGDSESRYSQVATVQNTTYSTIFLSAACIPAQDTTDLQALALPAPTAANVKSFGQALADPAKVAYTKDSIAFNAYVLQRIVSLDYSLTSNQIQPFTNLSIKSGAWRMNFAYDRKSSAPAYLPAHKQGTVLLIAGQNTWYYFMLAATQSQWQANGSTWSQMLSSVKVDQ